MALFAFGLSWWPFARWVRRRRGRLVRLFREGQLDTARIVNPRKHRIRGAPWTKLTLEIERAGRVRAATLSIGGHPPALFEPEATCPVLSHPEVDHCAAFVRGGEPVAAKFEAR